MLERIPDAHDLTALLGDELFHVRENLCSAIEEKYDMDCLWDKGYREWIYEYKYRRGGKTLCTLYAKEGVIGLQIIFGKDERGKLEARQNEFPEEILRTYEEAHIYHDGKWVMFFPKDTALTGDFIRLLTVKRRSNQKIQK